MLVYRERRSEGPLHSMRSARLRQLCRALVSALPQWVSVGESGKSQQSPAVGAFLRLKGNRPEAGAGTTWETI